MSEQVIRKMPLPELKVSYNEQSNKFVGIKCERDKDSGKYRPIIYMPMGFYSEDRLTALKEGVESDENLRQELFDDLTLVLRLIAEAAKKRREDPLFRQAGRSEDETFPVQAYFFIIQNYLENGLYKEREASYKTGLRGRINWPRTIKTQRAYIQDDEAYYLSFVTRKLAYRDDLIITLIHEAVVYKCFALLGSLFTGWMPPKPRLDADKHCRLFVSVLKNRLTTVFRDRERSLFRNMADVLENLAKADSSKLYEYGTHDFEYVWEYAVDAVFGEEDKKDFYPKAVWLLDGEEKRSAGSLRPDTIMKQGGNIYILDAKYYTFGITDDAGGLPAVSSIEKQITYGEYLDKRKKDIKVDGDILNAFIMPFNYEDNKGSVEVMGEGGIPFWNKRHARARAQWKENEAPKPYETVYAICADVKSLLEAADKGGSETEKQRLAEYINGCRDATVDNGTRAGLRLERPPQRLRRWSPLGRPRWRRSHHR